MRIYCNTCKIELSEELQLLDDYMLLSAEEEKSFIPKGYYLISDGEFYTNTVGQILINLDDVINVDDHTDKSRLHGCCGLDGCDGPNKLCSNGHEVGTERSDCWLPWSMAFDEKLVFLK